MTKRDEFAQGQSRVLSNTTYLLAASVIQKFISLGYFVYYVRVLGPTNTGIFEPVRSIIPIALVVIDFALSTVLTREIARRPERAVAFVNNVLSVKVILAIVALMLTLGVNAVFEFDQLTRELLFLAGIVIGLDMFTMTYTAALRGIQIFRYEAIGIILTQTATAAAGITAVSLDAGIVGLMIAFIAGSLVNIGFMVMMFRRKFGTLPRLAWDGQLVRQFMAIALPILGAQLLAKLFTYTDRYLLLHTKGETEVGLYVAAHKAPFALEFIAGAFAASLLPAMSRAFIEAKDQLGRSLEQALRYLLIISIPITVGIFVLAHPFITKLYNPQFSEATVPLQIMILALPFIFMNYPVGNFLIATNRQIWNTVNLGVAVIINVGVNVLLQPALGTNGAAVAVLSSYGILFFLGLIQARRVAAVSLHRITRVFLQTIVAAAVMAVPLVLLQKTFSPYFLVIPGAILYVAALFVVGGIRRADLALLLRAIGRKSA